MKRKRTRTLDIRTLSIFTCEGHRGKKKKKNGDEMELKSDSVHILIHFQALISVGVIFFLFFAKIVYTHIRTDQLVNEIFY